MGNLLKKVTPQSEQLNKQLQHSSSLLSLQNGGQEISRSNFKLVEKLSVSGHHKQQVLWVACNKLIPSQKFLLKQISKLVVYDNNRIPQVLKQLQLLTAIINSNQARMIKKLFGQVFFAFQDYQYCYLVEKFVDGFMLDQVLRQHVFTEDQTKYVVASIVQIIQYLHQLGYSLTQMAPQHFIVEKTTGRIKLIQIFNPMLIDTPYAYDVVTETPFYAAPEILARQKVLAQSDFYSLGMIMYEMMTQKVQQLCQFRQESIEFQNSVQDQLKHLDKIQRNQIIAQQIQIKKYNLPQGWDPQAADFLVKLLIKNPAYRPGRYGTFEICYHPWLQNYNWQTLNNHTGVSLSQAYFKDQPKRAFKPYENIQLSRQNKMSYLKDKLFLSYFEKYTYRIHLKESEKQSKLKSNKSYHKIDKKQKHTKIEQNHQDFLNLQKQNNSSSSNQDHYEDIGQGQSDLSVKNIIKSKKNSAKLLYLDQSQKERHF